MMKMNRFLFSSFVLAVVCVFAASGPALAASYNGNYSENFNGIGGSTGATLPSGWTIWYDNDGGSHTTWNTGITAAQVLGMGSSGTQTSVTGTGTPIVDTGITSSHRDADQWYNIARVGDTGNRVVTTSPTTNAGLALQLALTNNTSSVLNQITISYQIVQFHNGWDNTSEAPPSQETLPGYRLFYAIGSTGSTWNPVSTLDPTLANFPQGTLGTLSSLPNLSLSTTIALSSAWGIGQDLFLRWVDDNAQGLSPDNVIGLDNVQVVPIPAAAWLLGTGLVGLVALRRRKK